MRRSQTRLRLLGPLALSACLALSGCVAGAPATGADSTPPATTDGGTSGDAELLRLIRPSFLAPTDRVAVAVIDDDGVRTAFIDADHSTTFEIGSITKPFTGELLALAIERGEVRADDPVGRYLDLGDAPVASVTLRDLAAHRGGIPTFPTDPEWVERVSAAIESGEDGIDETVDEMLAEARGVEVAPGRGFSYSNMGAALVGQALAAAAGTDYRSLVTERLLEPLGLDGASLPLTGEEVPASHAGGFAEDGDAVAPSSLAAYAPAGGIDATIDDLAVFAQAVLDGPLTGSAAQSDLIEVGDGSRIGYFWNVRDDGEHRIVSHNGMTLGFASVLLIDTTDGTAAIVLSNRQASVDDVGATLLAHLG
ncbi:serine hydrolase domain-containing protein [Agromyces aurantiacus]|uniref:Serine hydrolase domain-containing protein n=1 Tax=Agromyces aurantiacus TaxID=165814 RepID=A0ABV9R3D3_9MICO|nr:serine hydrolase domain-containing protein [Agromyces aurantiacus]MBM7503286.1 CubicO group peptidase (beta-lactamase class C family) [Agromyces aurantiacus]